MLANRPHLTGTKWDAAIAAVMEHTARVHGYEPPSWVNEPERFLETAVNLTRPETDSDSAWQPGAFLRHGVNIDIRDLEAPYACITSREPWSSTRSCQMALALRRDRCCRPGSVIRFPHTREALLEGAGHENSICGRGRVVHGS